MKKGFYSAISEVKSSINKLIIFDTFINVFLTFLILLLVFSAFGFSFLFPSVISAVYFIFSLHRRLKINQINLVESRYRNLNEKLRTAEEYAKEDSPVVKELKGEVLADLQGVEQSAFLNEKRIYIKSLAVVILSFAVLLISPFTVGVFDFGLAAATDPVVAEETAVSGSGDSRIKFAVCPQDAGIRKAGDNIYGEPIVAKLGDDEIKVRINPAGTELNIREIQESDLPDFSESYPSDVQAVAAESYAEDIPVEELELVKNYFNGLAEG